MQNRHMRSALEMGGRGHCPLNPESRDSMAIHGVAIWELKPSRRCMQPAHVHWKSESLGT